MDVKVINVHNVHNVFDVLAATKSEEGARRILGIIAKRAAARKANSAATCAGEWFRGMYAKSIADRCQNALNRSAEAAVIAADCWRRGDRHAGFVWSHASKVRRGICNRLQAKAPVYASGGCL